MYQRRSKLLRRGKGYDFFQGYKKREQDVLEVLADLVVGKLFRWLMHLHIQSSVFLLIWDPTESFQGTVKFDKHGRPRCKNQNQLLSFILNSKILLNDRRAPKIPGKDQLNPLLSAVKVICSSLLFEHNELKHHVFAIEQLQHAVYAATNKAPIYHGIGHTDINMEWTMNCLDFFRYHMMSKESMMLSAKMEELPTVQKPSAWQEPLKNGAVALSKHWKGTYSFLDPREQLRLRDRSDEDDSDVYFSDKNIDEGKIQEGFPQTALHYKMRLTEVDASARLSSDPPSEVAETIRRTSSLLARGRRAQRSAKDTRP